MIPITTTLTGALGIRAGLNRDSITLDLSSIPDDALTVAVRGDNGQGKSTLLNLALTPWREPPQITGNIYDQFGPTGLRELIWSHGGEEYWSRIEYKQTAKTKGQKATLKVKRNGAWEPVRLPDNTVSDGKSGTYDACLEHVLGPQDLYYLAAFRAQNAPKLAEHTDPKGLMRALLALDEPAALSDQAREVVRELKRHHEAIRSQAQTATAQGETIVRLEGAVQLIDAEHPARRASKTAAQEAAARARAELDRAIAGDLDRQRLIEQRAAVERRLRACADTTSTADTTADNALAAARRRRLEAQQQGRATLEALESDLAKAAARLQSAQQTLAERDAIMAAESEVAALENRIAGQERTLETQRSEIDRLRALAAEIQTLEANQAHAAQDGKTRKARLDELTARAGFVVQVPCRGEGEYAACPALAEAQAAAGQIAEAQAAVEARRAEWKAINAKIKALSTDVGNLGSLQGAQRETQSLLGTLRLKLDAARQTTAKRSALDLAEQHLAEAQAAVEDLSVRLEHARADLDATLSQLDDEIATAQSTLEKTRASGAAAVAAVRAELDAIPEPGTDQAVALARQRLADAEAAAESAQAAIDQASATKTAHVAEIARLRAAVEQSAQLLEHARRLEAEIADWTLLAAGLRGVIDLSIEDAGPGIASLANRLLTEAYGPRFTVRIVTQRTQQNGVVRECFDISVIDAESGLESSILQKSGGEAVWLDKALTDAVGLYHQEAAGTHYECLFADEAEDGLTQARKAQFYRMDRAALALGGYRRKFFISHNPDAWAMADHVIDLADYRTAA